MKLYPIFANIEGKKAVIIGGGDVACRKLADLLDAGAQIKLISPEINDTVYRLQEKNPYVELVNREYKNGDLAGAAIAFAATNRSDINRLVFQEAESLGILINSVDDPENSSFYVPSMVRKGSLVLAVSTGGDSPAMAAKLRRKFEKDIPGNIDEILSALREVRDILKNMKGLASHERGEIMKKIVNDDRLLKDLGNAWNKNKLEEMLKKLL